MARQVRSASDAAQNWANAMAHPNAAAKYTQGVQKVTTSPTAKAASAEALAKYQANTTRAVASGHMASRLNAVSLQQWQQAAAQQGAQNLAKGAAKGKAKAAAAFQRLAPVWQAMADTVDNMPSGGLANAIARVTAALQVQAQMTGRA